MKIKTSSLLLLGFAVVLAGCAAFVARGLLAPHAAERPAAAAQAKASEAQVPPVWAAAAAKPVEPGEFLSGTAIKWVEMKADEAPASAISAKRPGDRTAAALLMGATVRRSVPQGELITQDDVLDPGNPGFLAAVLSQGKRAVSIPTSAVSSNSGLVSAGDWVDVILTLKRETAEAMADQQDKTSGMTKLAAQTILTNVRVLALNNSTESIAPQPETAPQKTDAKKTASTAARRVDYRTITLEVTPMEAQALAVAKEAGDLQVSIRGLREPETKDAAGTSAVNEKTAAVTHLQDATGILGTQRPAAKTVITYQGAAVAPVTF